MVRKFDFNEIARYYEKTSLVQQGASETLFQLLEIKKNESVLDVGCGPGNITKKIRDLSDQRVAGVDIACGMIEEAKKNYGSSGIDFRVGDVSSLDFENEFDVIFCNSSFQWFRSANKSVAGFYRALKREGRVGIQAPGGGRYCENFLHAVECVRQDESTAEIFSTWKNPFFMPERASDYSAIFEKAGFNVVFSEIQATRNKYTAEETFNIFSSGAIAGYLNQEYYGEKITAEYEKRLKAIVHDDFRRQADKNNMVELIFRRIFLIGIKP
jgi:ubiquinone/menaquinone biosynthesis C-methylase UbiE